MSASGAAATDARFRLLTGNPLRTRDDVAGALGTLFAPLQACRSPGGARVALDASGAAFDRAAAEFEGFARPLWGLAAAAAGGVDDPAWWPFLRRGLASGVDPANPEYWGDVAPFDQRLVELAAIALALCVAPDRLWHPLAPRDRQHVLAYLMQAHGRPCHANNWQFFHVLIDLALRRLGEHPAAGTAAAALAAIDRYYLGDGWYRDGAVPRIDHYNGLAFHTYGLLYARLAPPGDPHAQVFHERAVAFAQQYRHCFADDGAVLPFGRSLTYRFACAAFWGACAFADVEALPWAEMKGLYLRHLRWWARQPITRGDGLLTVGYAYPNAMIAENYSAPSSPYWAFKAFLPLALPADHPFWTAEEAAKPAAAAAVVAIPAAGMLIAHEPGQTVALCAGQAHPGIRFGAEKYAKFAYSTRYAFSIESDLRRFDAGTFDSMLALADADGSWRVREACEAWSIEDDRLFARWRPWHDVVVETWLGFELPWQVRVHRVRSGRLLRTIEGGFCVAHPERQDREAHATPGAAWIATADDFSGIADLAGVPREARLLAAEPNTNLVHPRTIVPQLAGRIAVGETWLCTGVLASPDIAGARTAWTTPPRDVRSRFAIYAA